MPTPDTNEQNDSLSDIKKQVHAIVEQSIHPNADRLDREQEFPRENLALLAEKGLNGVLLPESLGGLGISKAYTAFALIASEIAKACPSTALVYTMHVEATRIIYTYGNEEQWDRWLKAVRQGKVGTTSITEKAAGGRFWHSLSEAERISYGYLLDAEKSFTTSSGYADFYVLQTKSPNARQPGDISYFIVDGRQDGISAGEWNALGVRGTHSSPLTFYKVFIDESDRVGEEGNGEDIVMNGAGYMMGLGATWTGTTRGIVTEAVNYAVRRTHQDTNKRLTDYQVIRSQLARAKILADSLEAWQKDLAARLDEWQQTGNPNLPEELHTSLLEFKVYASETANEVAQMAMDVAGGYGYKKGTLERFYRDARAGIAMGPSNHLARDIIGKKLAEEEAGWQKKQ